MSPIRSVEMGRGLIIKQRVENNLRKSRAHSDRVFKRVLNLKQVIDWNTGMENNNNCAGRAGSETEPQKLYGRMGPGEQTETGGRIVNDGSKWLRAYKARAGVI